ncbi:MAG: hypothetical protein PHT60_14415 [Acidiphilium sp.]|nr:hypothetical protein [Acidiphilium sp.]MDD4936955.1 hypothetical protein [Acidiphilium sp.]
MDHCEEVSPGVASPITGHGWSAPALGDVSDDTIARLVRDIEKTGFAMLPGYIAASDLKHLQQFVETKIADADNQYTALTGNAAFVGTMLGAIGESPTFLSLMHRIYAKAYGPSIPRQAIYQVLRCLKGETGLKHAYFFHYDSYVVTALLPIIVPTSGNMGNLLMKPNCRAVRSSYFGNLLDKLLVDNKLAQVLFRFAARTHRAGFSDVMIVPGNLYFFWGYRTIHANAPCDIDKIRATALFHFADPHAGSALRKITGRAKVRAAVEKEPELAV